MKAKIKPLLWTGIFLSTILIYNNSIYGKLSDPSEKVEKRPDIIHIRTMEKLGALERPEVLFLHDQHTQTLQTPATDCSACHLKKDDTLSLKFKRAQDLDETTLKKEALMEVYHDNCMGCHKERSADNKKSGPVTCGECHVDAPDVKPDRDPMGFSLNLHYRHAKAADNKCEKCHHAYDEKNKKLIYLKGEEGSCRYCHKTDDEENRISFQKSSHMACIACHQEKIAAGMTSGPVYCMGCHDKKEKQNIKVLDTIPRMERNQPDTIFIKRFDMDVNKATEKDLENLLPEYRMPLVPFNHKGHEADTSTCRQCHHAALSACSKCHTVSGSDAGNFIKLEQAMHQENTVISCKGCHDIQKDMADCRGCHELMTKGQLNTEAFCSTCHLAQAKDAGSLTSMIKDNVSAENLLAALQLPENTIPESEIPQTVKINELTDKYEAVMMPHGKIVNTLLSNIKGNRLANAFHKGNKNTCKSCHHNSPEAIKPPKCSSCHGKPFNVEKINMPGLMGAYHQQCLGCHKAMAIAEPASTNCTACHKEKKSGE